MIVLTSKLVTRTWNSIDLYLHYATLTTLFCTALDLKSDFDATMSKPQGESEQALPAALTSQLQSLKPCNQLNAVSIILPEFWSSATKVWFVRAESQFGTKNITQDQTEYDYVVSALDIKTAEEVHGVLINLPETEKYSNLKKKLIKAFGKPQAKRDSELLNLNGLGDRKPIALLQKMNSLNDDLATLKSCLFVLPFPRCTLYSCWARVPGYGNTC